MSSNYIGKLKKVKKRRILVLSGSGPQGGIQCIYLSVDSSWEILSHASIPYPQKIASLLESISMQQNDSSFLSELAWLDLKISHLFIECARTTLAQVSRFNKTPHLIVLNKTSIWKGSTGENLQQAYWDLTAGDAQFISSNMNVPVYTDFIRHNILAGGPGLLPMFPGNLSIASKCPGLAILVNIGVVTRITIIDTATSTLLIDSDTGPGTGLIDKVMKDISLNDTFDRDGTLASQGFVDGECLNTLVTSDWFLKPFPKQASGDQFDSLLEYSSFKALQPFDRLATITALTARSLYNFFRSEYKGSIMPEKIYISGGGAHNLTLMEYLAAYFQPLHIVSIEELGVPVDLRIPLALGLTVNSYVSGNPVPWETGNNPKIMSIGKWIFP